MKWYGREYKRHTSSISYKQKYLGGINLKKASYRKDKGIFVFSNTNPKNKVRAADCVARAISGATGKPWDDVIREITEFGIKKGLVFNEKAAFGPWLQKQGWYKNPQPRKRDNTKYTVKEFVEEFCQEGTCILSLANHLTYVKDGILYDTWNCSYKTVGNWWSK